MQVALTTSRGGGAAALAVFPSSASVAPQVAASTVTKTRDSASTIPRWWSGSVSSASDTCPRRAIRGIHFKRRKVYMAKLAGKGQYVLWDAVATHRLAVVAFGIGVGAVLAVGVVGNRGLLLGAHLHRRGGGVKTNTCELLTGRRWPKMAVAPLVNTEFKFNSAGSNT